MTRFDHILLESQYIPSMEYFALMYQAECILLERQEHYVKGSYRNRTHIAGANGVLRLSVPLKGGKNQNMPIDRVEISYAEDWVSNHWRSIQSAYGSAPYFIHYRDQVKDILFEEVRTLWRLNRAFIDFLKKALNIPSPIEETTEYRHNPEQLIDLREALHPKQDDRIQVDLPPYGQVFREKHGFIPSLGALDLLFCTGPEAPSYLRKAEIELIDASGLH